MSETRMLLAKISALRQRLEQAQGLANEARSAAAALLGDGEEGERQVIPLPQLVEQGSELDVELDYALRPLTVEVEENSSSPRQLTSRARRVLDRGRELLGQLRGLADVFAPGEGPLREVQPLTFLYRDTVSLIDTTLRTVALLPDSASAQMQLCRGLEVALEEVSGRLDTLVTGAQRQHEEDNQLARLAGVLIAVDAGHQVDLGVLRGLTEELLTEAQECENLRFLQGDPQFPPQFVACHNLTVARVLARIVRADVELRNRAHDVILAGLLHDVGMLGVPPEILAHPALLDGNQRRVIEGHAIVGAQQVSTLFPDAPWLTDAIGAHHERLNGTGYPDGLKGNKIRPLARLLAVADVYAALCCDRPQRPGRATRTALADTLMLAEQEQLDRNYAECLLSLSFYPIGSVVELAHGAVGVVVATPRGRNDVAGPARPVVALLTDSQGQPLARPRHLDLSQSESYSIVRSLTAQERADLLGRQFPQWAA